MTSWKIRALAAVGVLLSFYIVQSTWGSAYALFSSSFWGDDGAVGGILNVLSFCGSDGCGEMVTKTFHPAFIDTLALFFTISAILVEAGYMKARKLLEKVVYSLAALIAISYIAQYFNGGGNKKSSTEVSFSWITNASVFGRLGDSELAQVVTISTDERIKVKMPNRFTSQSGGLKLCPQVIEPSKFTAVDVQSDKQAKTFFLAAADAQAIDDYLTAQGYKKKEVTIRIIPRLSSVGCP